MLAKSLSSCQSLSNGSQADESASLPQILPPHELSGSSTHYSGQANLLQLQPSTGAGYSFLDENERGFFDSYFDGVAIQPDGVVLNANSKVVPGEKLTTSTADRGFE